MSRGERGRRWLRAAAYAVVLASERRWDALRVSRRAHRAPEHFRIDSYGGHGTGDQVLVRGRVVDDPETGEAADGESAWAALRRTVGRFLTDELPGVPLTVRIGSASVETVTDDEGYFEVRLSARDDLFTGPWATGEVATSAPYRGLVHTEPARVRVRVSGPGAAFGVVSDVDDTILHTGAQRASVMIRQTLFGSELTRTPFVGAPELYRALAAGGRNPVFYVSSSPWNLHGFLVAFLRHRDFPPGPLLLRDLLGSSPERSHRSHKLTRIDEVLGLHPDLTFVLVGDSGQHDPAIYAEVVHRYPGRIQAVYIRDVRLDPGDRRVEAIAAAWTHDVPFVLVADSAALARHAANLGLIARGDMDRVEQATTDREVAGDVR
jgi:phosphatidate phosphatase APP1